MRLDISDSFFELVVLGKCAECGINLWWFRNEDAANGEWNTELVRYVTGMELVKSAGRACSRRYCGRCLYSTHGHPGKPRGGIRPEDGNPQFEDAARLLEDRS